MGKETGFLEYRRKDPGYRPRAERLGDYRPVDNRLSDADIHRQAARCMDCGIPFCHGYGCPVANIIPEFNDLVYRGRWPEALDILCATNNFPEFTGRLCPATCETACVAGINTEPVTIRQIELAVIEKGFELGLMGPRSPQTRRNETVAVVGSGPAGLAAADTLNKLGYTVTVFDEARYPGGILRYGIPDFKLDKKIVERRIELMTAEGVRFESEVRVGTDISCSYLRKQNRAICLACGSRQPRDLPVPGRELNGILFAMDFLGRQNRVVSGEIVPRPSDVTARGKRVVVIGGGDTGSDCLGTALRQGAAKVWQLEILPEPPTQRPEHTPWPMWPATLRESHAHKEGGERQWAVTTKAFLGDGNSVQKLLCARVEWVQEADGSMKPQDVAGSEFELDADLVVLAMGFVGPGNQSLIDNFAVAADARGNIAADETMMTSVPGVFVAGDMTSGQSLIVRAIASGRRTAFEIDRYLAALRHRRADVHATTTDGNQH